MERKKDNKEIKTEESIWDSYIPPQQKEEDPDLFKGYTTTGVDQMSPLNNIGSIGYGGRGFGKGIMQQISDEAGQFPQPSQYNSLTVDKVEAAMLSVFGTGGLKSTKKEHTIYETPETQQMIDGVIKDIMSRGISGIEKEEMIKQRSAGIAAHEVYKKYLSNKSINK